jgi:hypothetical protein
VSEIDRIDVPVGAVAMLDGVSVGVANLWEREYRLADGGARTGPSVMLFLDDGRDFPAGPGTGFAIDGNDWLVADLREGPGRGAVTFERRPAP